MADFALGLAKAAVEGTLSRVQSAIDEENKLKAAAQQDLVFITGEFQMMHSFLNVANKERARNEVVRTWVRQLRDLAFDVEDCVEFVIHIDNDSTSNWVWRMLPSCIAPPQTRDLDVAVAELKLLKARVEEVSQRNTRYNLISDSGSNPDSQPPPPAEQLATTGPSTIDILMELWEASGRHRGFCTLQKLITNEGNDLQVISLWGSAGSDIEGTQIISKAYCDPKICHIFKVRAWVKLMHPFNPDEFLTNLRTRLQASSRSCQAVDFKVKTSEDDPMKQLTEQRYLIIFEGVSSVEEWDFIRMYLPDNNNGSRIVVSTKQLGDAIFFTGEHYRVSVLREFTGGHYLCAFYKKESGRRNVMGDLIRILRRPIVISIWGAGDDKSTLVRELLDIIPNENEEILNSQGAECILRAWVDVAYPFVLKDFCLVLLRSFYKNNNESGEDDTEVGEVIEQGCLSLLQSFHKDNTESGEGDTEVGEVIEQGFLSLLHSFRNDNTGSSEDGTDRNDNTESSEDGTEGSEYDVDIGAVIEQGLHKVLGEHGRQCQVVINGLQSTKEWQLIKSAFKEIGIKGYIILITNDESVATNCVDYEYHAFKVNNVALHPSMQIHDYMDELFWRLRHHRVISVCGAGGDTSTVLKQVYDGIKHQHVGFKEVGKFKYYGWVDVPHPFNKDEFRLRLLKGLFPDVYADNFHLALKRKCIFIVNGLQSTEEWELIKPYLMKGNSKSRIILIAKEESVVKHFVEHLQANTAIRPLTKASDYYRYGDNKKAFRSIFLSNRAEVSLWAPSQEKVLEKIWNSIECSTMPTSVWGIAGVGKTSLVRSTYDYARMPENKFAFQRFAWVDVSAGPFDLVEFSRLLLLDFHRYDLEAMEAAAIGVLWGRDPIQGCREILRQGQYLVIIDGLRSTYDWDLIETVLLSQPTTNDKIVVITTEESISKHIVKQQVDNIINVKCVEDDDAYDYIFKKLIDPDGTELASRMGNVDLAKLVAKCGGLPKIVSAIGKVSWSFLEHMNDDFMVKLETDPQFHSLSGLLSWMHSYFDACSDLVKPCIFYMSVFPASSKIRQGRLVRRWIAEGYSRDTPGCTARENAEKRFSELVKLSIIQQARSQVICQVNGFFHEYIISRPMEDNLVFALDGRCSPNTQQTGQHLTITADWHRDQNVFDSIDFARLRSLTMFGTWCSFFISDKMKRLRVLDLEGMTDVTNADIEQIFVKLLNLKFISLRGCRKISRLPDTLGGLRQLQTLDVRFTSIVMLPSTIIKLQKLQYIRAGTIVLPDEDWTSASSEDGGVTSQLPAATSPEEEGRDSNISAGQSTVHISPENGIAASPAQAATSPEAQDRPMLPKVGWASKLACTSLPRWSKFPPVTWNLWMSERERQAQHHNGGVELPVGIEKLVALHTVGVVNVNSPRGEAFLKQLKELTQLLKLRVCGINKKNWQLLCCALSIHGHLESLSVRFDEDCLDDSFKPPETLKSLKLYVPIMKLPDSIKVLVNLKKVDLEMTITRLEDMHLFLKHKLPRQRILNRLCIKVQGDHKVDFSSGDFYYSNFGDVLHPRVVKIDCSANSEVTFGGSILYSVEVLIIQCSKGSSVRASASDEVIHMPLLKTVWLKGSYSEEQREHLQVLVDRHDKKPLLKLEPLQ